eukprot:1153641-Pelagomonas_calceolata.AAC.4
MTYVCACSTCRYFTYKGRTYWFAGNEPASNFAQASKDFKPTREGPRPGGRNHMTSQPPECAVFGSKCDCEVIDNVSKKEVRLYGRPTAAGRKHVFSYLLSYQHDISPFYMAYKGVPITPMAEQAEKDTTLSSSRGVALPSAR